MKKRAAKVNMVEMGQVKPAPAKQGEFRIDARTVIDIPVHIKPEDLDKWKAKMTSKYDRYERRNEIGRLTGAAKNRVKEQL